MDRGVIRKGSSLHFVSRNRNHFASVSHSGAEQGAYQGAYLSNYPVLVPIKQFVCSGFAFPSGVGGGCLSTYCSCWPVLKTETFFVTYALSWLLKKTKVSKSKTRV
jgi:hypothetical protein